MDGRSSVPGRCDRDWDLLTERAVRAHMQASVLSIVNWFGLSGMMLSALYGAERFLVEKLDAAAVIATCATLCGLVIVFALGGTFSVLRLIHYRGKWGAES